MSSSSLVNEKCRCRIPAQKKPEYSDLRTERVKLIVTLSYNLQSAEVYVMFGTLVSDEYDPQTLE